MGGAVSNKVVGFDWNETNGLNVICLLGRGSPAQHDFVIGAANSTNVALANGIIAASNGTESQFRAAMPTTVLNWYDNLSSTDRGGFKDGCEAMRTAGIKLVIGHDYDA